MVSGDLKIFPFMPVMQMLLASGKEGQVTLQHPRGGSLWLEPGLIVHAKAGKLTGEAALQMMCSVNEGTFTYEPEKKTTEHTLSLRQEAALRHLLIEADGWDNVLPQFSDWNQKLRFTARWSDAQPVTRQQFQALRLIPQNLKLQDMLERLGQPPREVLETIQLFITAGLVEFQ